MRKFNGDKKSYNEVNSKPLANNFVEKENDKKIRKNF